ncbi:hypothetical protein [Methylobacterium sp. 092160098-2]|uniref:hypothetical protein n=1 Tax=Methylobacterium sp. 092160098-2 TaxID=3025129 RepID=UPI002381BB9B|nr:hypothetical protein [Methylobacterium sp. 092160098-2]MDE4915051.1 hypothetical protein [Methylobacterium sp. 092160098-2]
MSFDQAVATPRNPAARWHLSFESLSPHASPCRYLTPTRWAAMRENCLDFIDRFGGQAHDLGWTARQLFGVHPDHGTLRVDYCGALVVGLGAVRGVEAERVLFTRTSAYRNRPGQEWGPTIWEFAAKAG